MTKLEKENKFLKQMLLDADAIARKRGDKYGLCNAMLRDEAYPSVEMAELIDRIQREGFVPHLCLDDALASARNPKSPWYDPDAK